MLVAGQEQGDPGLCDAIGANELEATAEKCGVLKDILLGLVDKCAALEQQCMGLEDQTTRDMGELKEKEQYLNEGMKLWGIAVLFAMSYELSRLFSSKHNPLVPRRHSFCAVEFEGRETHTTSTLMNGDFTFHTAAVERPN